MDKHFFRVYLHPGELQQVFGYLHLPCPKPPCPLSHIMQYSLELGYLAPKHAPKVMSKLELTVRLWCEGYKCTKVGYMKHKI